MAAAAHGGEEKREFYSVWAMPPEEVKPRLKKLMEGVRSEFGGQEFEPHMTVAGEISLTESEACERFSKACEGLNVYTATVEKVARALLLIRPTPEVVEANAHFCAHFGYKNSSPYMPHVSLVYCLSDEEEKQAEERVHSLDETIGDLHFQISRLAYIKPILKT